MRTFAKFLCVAFVAGLTVGLAGCKKEEAAKGGTADAATMEKAKNMMGQQYQKNAELQATKKAGAPGGTGAGQPGGK